MPRHGTCIWGPGLIHGAFVHVNKDGMISEQRTSNQTGTTPKVQ